MTSRLLAAAICFHNPLIVCLRNDTMWLDSESCGKFKMNFQCQSICQPQNRYFDIGNSTGWQWFCRRISSRVGKVVSFLSRAETDVWSQTCTETDTSWIRCWWTQTTAFWFWSALFRRVPALFCSFKSGLHAAHVTAYPAFRLIHAGSSLPRPWGA